MIPKRDNYAIMACQCRDRFLTYDQSAILRNIPLAHDADSFYLPVLGRICRIDRHTGFIYWSTDRENPSTQSAETFTIFDYLCDADPDRHACGTFVSMASLGRHTHAQLLSPGPTPALECAIDRNPETFSRSCLEMGGISWDGGDLSYRLHLFPDLPVLLRFWHADEEFPPQLQILWDAQTLSFIRYETTYYACSMIRARLTELMASTEYL